MTYKQQLNQALDQLTQLKQSHDDTQAQLIGHSQKYDEEVVGKLAELDIVTMDLERANARIIQLEKTIDDLKESHVTNSETEVVAESQLEHDAEISKLIKDVDAYRDILQKTESRLSTRIKELTVDVTKLSEENEQLRSKLKNFDDYDEIKRELQIMKYVEFSTGEDEFDANDVLKKEMTKDSLEVQLMEKNKRLESEYTQMKVSYADIKKENERNIKLTEELNTKIAEQTKLVQRLEEDLLRLGQKTDQPDTFTASRNGSSTNLATLTTEHTPRQSLESIREDKSILPIVMSQRDRFRQKNAELEERLKSLETALQEANMEVSSLKSDNLKLYERLKFVHVWKEGQQERNDSIALNMGSESSTIPSMRQFKRTKLSDDPADKYSRLYEESMNPFTQFHRKEEIRRYNALNPAEKLTLKLTRVLFSHKWSRYFFIVYSLLLHLLVVVTLYQLSLWECRHDHEAINFPTNNDDALSGN